MAVNFAVSDSLAQSVEDSSSSFVINPMNILIVGSIKIFIGIFPDNHRFE